MNSRISLTYVREYLLSTQMRRVRLRPIADAIVALVFSTYESRHYGYALRAHRGCSGFGRACNCDLRRSRGRMEDDEV